MEVDFLIRKDKKIIPIEAKSGKTFAIKSLRNFKTKFTNIEDFKFTENYSHSRIKKYTPIIIGTYQ